MLQSILQRTATLFATGTSTRAMSSSSIAVAQLCATDNKFDNLCNVAKCAALANKQQASMLFLPECFGYMGRTSEQTLVNAEPSLDVIQPNPPGVTQALADIVLGRTQQGQTATPHEIDNAPTISLMDGLQTIATTSNLWISAGGMHVRVDTDGNDNRVYNTHVVLDGTGALCATYRKIHLFDVQLPTVDLQESKTTKAGTDCVICPSTPIGTCGLSVCYDLRFPEQYVHLTHTMKAQVLLVPSAFTVPTGRAHWHTLLQARAIENQCFVIAAAQFGRHNEKRSSYGHSLVVDPWGTILADAGGMDSPDSGSSIETPSIVTCEIDLERVESTRQRMPIQSHRNNAVSF